MKNTSVDVYTLWYHRFGALRKLLNAWIYINGYQDINRYQVRYVNRRLKQKEIIPGHIIVENSFINNKGPIIFAIHTSFHWIDIRNRVVYKLLLGSLLYLKQHEWLDWFHFDFIFWKICILFLSIDPLWFVTLTFLVTWPWEETWPLTQVSVT